MLVEEAATLTEFGICDETTGLRDVTQELKFRVTSSVERVNQAGLMLDLSQQCYQLLDKVLRLYNFQTQAFRRRCFQSTALDFTPCYGYASTNHGLLVSYGVWTAFTDYWTGPEFILLRGVAKGDPPPNSVTVLFTCGTLIHVLKLQ